MALPAHLVVGLGEALWDMLPTGKHLGGAPLNFAYIASLLGEHAIIASRIGNDSLGAEIQSELAGRNLDTSGIQTDLKLPTGTVEVRFRAGQPEYEIRQPVAWDALEWTPKWREIAANCDAVCCGSIDSSLHLAAILKLNDVELPEIAAILGLKSASNGALMRELLDKYGLKVVLVTCGERGAMAAQAEKVVSHPGFKVRVRDTIGAGDAFTAAAIHCILRGLELEKTLAFANKWASWVASEAGAMPQMDDAQRLKMLAEAAVSVF